MVASTWRHLRCFDGAPWNLYYFPLPDPERIVCQRRCSDQGERDSCCKSSIPARSIRLREIFLVRDLAAHYRPADAAFSHFCAPLELPRARSRIWRATTFHWLGGQDTAFDSGNRHAWFGCHRSNLLALGRLYPVDQSMTHDASSLILCL